ncbi:hypothetical protein SBA4_3030017 [Candidatus Sulfopaludibacter sp. SbA4]|nr:hypothetical protein SBA4_3030017 [Candidatus Sulfopaludibacter sp. SbA4]
MVYNNVGGRRAQRGASAARMRWVSRFLYLFALIAPAALPEQLPIQIYTTADGLAHNHINCIRQDSRGFIWICTDEGLTRFDGYRLTSFTTSDGLPHPWINDLIETRDGTLWIASDGGVTRFNPKRSSSSEPLFATYLPDQHPDARRVNALAEDAEGAIWCATYNGLYRLDRASGGVKFQWVDIGLPGEANEGRLVNNLVTDDNALTDNRGALWLTARTGLYRRLADGRTEHYTTRHGLPDNFIGALLQDRGGRWWAATRMGGFCLLAAEPDPSRRVVERCYSTADGLPHNDVRSIFQSADGRMWIGTILGLSEFTPGAAGGKLFHNYTTGPARGRSLPPVSSAPRLEPPTYTERNASAGVARRRPPLQNRRKRTGNHHQYRVHSHAADL